MKRFIFWLALLCLPTNSMQAQSVQQSGTVTPGHATKWITNGVIGDAGTASNGSLTSLGVTNNGGLGICVNSGPITGPYNQTCLSSTTNGGSKLSSYAYGGATSPGFIFDINGATQGFPTITLPVANNDFACFNGTAGNLKDCGGNISGATVPNHEVVIGTGNAFHFNGAGPGASGLPFVGGGASADPSFAILTVPGGGTGLGTLTAHGVLLGQGTSSVLQAVPSTAGYALVSTGASSDPTFSANYGAFVGAVTSGSANAQTLAATIPTWFTLTAGYTVCAKAGFTNTGATTLAANGTAATAINSRSTSGLSALAGGEIKSGVSYCWQYDGSVYEQMTTLPGAVEQKSGNYVATAVDGNGDTYIFTAAATLTVPQSTTIPNNWKIFIYAEGGNVTITPNAADSINGGSTGASVTLNSGASSFVTTDGAGNIYVPTAVGASPIALKQPVQVASTGSNLTLSGEQTIDGILTSGSRILVKNQSTPSQNGIYVTASGSWTLAGDWATGQVAQGTQVFITQGTVNGGQTYSVTTSGAIAVGSTSVAFGLLPSFHQSGTSSTTVTMQSKVAQTISAKDFGATGNGSTDDTVALQACINQAEAVHSGCYIPAGKYVTTSPLSITSRMQLYGDGYQSSGQQCYTVAGCSNLNAAAVANATTIIPGSNSNGVNIASPDGVQVHDLQIAYTTQPTALSGITGLSIGPNSSSNIISQVYVWNMMIAGADRGIYSTECVHCSFHNNQFYNEVSYSIYVDGVPATTNVVDSEIASNTFVSGSASTFSHIYFNAGGGWRIVNNKLDTGGSVNNTTGILISPQAVNASMEPMVIVGNSIEGNNIGIYFTNPGSGVTATQGVISGNQIWGSNNSTLSTKGIGIKIDSGTQWVSGYTISGNYINVDGGSGGYNIYIGNSSASNMQIAGNTLSGNGVGSVGLFLGTGLTNIQVCANAAVASATITENCILNNNGIGATSTDGIWLQNTTAASVGAQQWSPRLHLTGQGWKTTSTAASQTVDWIVENQPVQGSTNPGENLTFSAQINGAGYGAAAYITNAGQFNVATGFQIGAAAASGNVLRGNGTNFVSATLSATDLAAQAANTVLVNATSGSASPTAQAVSGCSSASSALIWTTNTGFGCNTSITANAVPAANLTGATLASGVTASSLTSLGTITSLTATTINAFTLGGTIAGGGNQINNVIIGTSTPLAGFFTTLNATTSVTSPTHYGGSSAGSTLTLQSTSSGSPSGDFINMVVAGTSRMKIFSDGGVAFSGASSPGTGNVVFAGILTAVTLNLSGLPSSTAAQSGTVCYNSGTAAVSYDPSLGCLTSLEELKSIHGPIHGALAKVVALRPFWFSPINRPANSDIAEQPGFGAHQVEAVDRRLVGYDAKGHLAGVRYMEMTAVLAAAIQELKASNDNLRAEIKDIKRAATR